ncbi:MAG: YhjD/YihY/BrkB family envelope integrity protein, partial [Calditrichia bacterium]
MNFLKTAFSMLKNTFFAFQDDKSFRMGAALSYYTVFSLAPFLIIVIIIAGTIFGQEAARGEIVSEIQGLIGRDGAKTVET